MSNTTKDRGPSEFRERNAKRDREQRLAEREEREEIRNATYRSAS